MGGRLQDRIAIVTGAGCIGPGWGNGRAIAVRFAEEGAKIFAVDRDLDSVTETVGRVKAAGGEIVTHQCDVTGAASVEVMVKTCVECFGRIDVLVNNVGGSAAGGPVDMSEDVWDAQVDYNLKSVFLTLKHVFPGQLHTPMVEARLAKQRTGGDVEALLKSRLDRIPLGFMGDGRDTANATLFLASDEARFITGTEIVVDGGMTVRCD
jgi:NAD(P)-dependent dehydrogenase (short-subunit alcohol dehydrogenase family)